MITRADKGRIDTSGEWLHGRLVLDDQLVLQSVIYNYIDEVNIAICYVEAHIIQMMESSKHWCKANKQFKDE